MTADHARTTVDGFGKTNRITPSPKRNLVSDMLGLITGMGIVTGCTGPALYVIYMKKVEIVTAVPKVGQGFSSLASGNITIVAAKTEVVSVLIIRAIETNWIETGQQPDILRTMDIVTSGTITGFNRPVPVLALGDDLAQIGVAVQAHLLHGIH